MRNEHIQSKTSPKLKNTWHENTRENGGNDISWQKAEFKNRAFEGLEQIM